MSRDTTVIAFRQPEAIDDPLSELAREGARRMLAQVLIAEADSFVAMWKDLKLPDGRDRIVRHGHGPHRAIQTGVGPVEVRRAKVRDLPRRSCQSGRGGRRVSMRCCRFSTCVECRPATSRRYSPHSWARTHRTEVYLRGYDSVSEARASIGQYLTFYNGRRPHSSLDGKTPDQAYFTPLPLRLAA
jgi:hypothetical protein